MADPSTRDRILDAAWSEVAERGMEALTLGGVGARAGLSRQAVYLHFGNRATLLVAMARRIDETSGFRRRVAEARVAPPLEAFRRLLAAWFDYLPTILPVALALEAANLTGGDGADAYRERMQDWWEAIRLAIDRLEAAGVLAAQWSAERAADWTWGSVHPATFHHLVDERHWSPADAALHLTGELERTLLASVPGG